MVQFNLEDIGVKCELKKEAAKITLSITQFLWYPAFSPLFHFSLCLYLCPTN